MNNEYGRTPELASTKQITLIDELAAAYERTGPNYDETPCGVQHIRELKDELPDFVSSQLPPHEDPLRKKYRLATRRMANGQLPTPTEDRAAIRTIIDFQQKTPGGMVPDIWHTVYMVAQGTQDENGAPPLYLLKTTVRNTEFRIPDAYEPHMGDQETEADVPYIRIRQKVSATEAGQVIDYLSGQIAAATSHIPEGA